jgi:hypothetical protein
MEHGGPKCCVDVCIKGLILVLMKSNPSLYVYLRIISWIVAVTYLLFKQAASAEDRAKFLITAVNYFALSFLANFNFHPKSFFTEKIKSLLH